MAPGEAHERLGTVERRNAVAREALETYAASRSDGHLPHEDTIREGLRLVPGQLNDLPNVSGYSPSQWVLNKASTIASSLSANDFNLAVQSASLDHTFTEAQAKRQAASTAVAEADSSSRLRRACLRQSRPAVSGFTVGELVF